MPQAGGRLSHPSSQAEQTASLGFLQTLFARVSPWCLCRVQDETSLPALHCGGESFSKFPLLGGELCPASIVASIVWLQMQRQSATPGFASLLYTRIRHGNRSLSEPRSKAKSARPTPIVTFCHNTTNFTKPRYLYRVCAAKKKKNEKISCPIAVQLGAVRIWRRLRRAAENVSLAAACMASTLFWQRCRAGWILCDVNQAD